MHLNLHLALLSLQISCNFPFARLQPAQLVTDRTRVAITPSDEVQAALDATFNQLQLFQCAPRCPMTFLPEADQLPLELSNELVDQFLVPKENVPQTVQHTPFQFAGTDSAIGNTRALLATRRTVVAIPSADCHTAATVAALEETGQKTLFVLALVTPAQ